MYEEIIEKLKEISNYPPHIPYVCIAEGQLNRIIGKIRDLDYHDFLKVLTYVRGSNLSSNFKKELENYIYIVD